MFAIGRSRRGARYPVLALLVVAGACYTAPRQVPTGQGLLIAHPEAMQQLGTPRVTLNTEYEYSGVRSVRTRVQLEDDAYVLVVNVTPDGVAQIVFPESYKEDGFLRGGKSYVLPGFFAGYPSMSLASATTTTRFVTVGRSAFASATLRGPGYLFVLASRTPFDMQRLEDEWYFDGRPLRGSLWELDPDEVVPAVADAALASVPYFMVSTDLARYAGYDPTAGARGNSYAYDRGVDRYCGLGLDMAARSLLFGSGWNHDYCLGGSPMPFRRIVPVPRQDSVPSDSTATPGGGDSTRAARPIWRRYASEVTTPSTLGGDVELRVDVEDQLRRRSKLADRRRELTERSGRDDGDARRPWASRAVDGDDSRRAARSSSGSSRPVGARSRRGENPSSGRWTGGSSRGASSHAGDGASSGSSRAGSTSGSAGSSSQSGGASAPPRPTSKLPDRP